MKILNVLVVDDEPIAQEILERYIDGLPFLNLVAKCSNAQEALAVLNKEAIDVMFMDINMPGINGIDFMKLLKAPPMTVFTTAYTEYAVESYELKAVDYLLKPISEERFRMAIDKILELHKVKPEESLSFMPMQSKDDQILFVKTNGKLHKIDLNELWLVEALKDYIKLYIASEKIIVYSTMKNFESKLVAFPYFLRVNKSNIINIKYVSDIEGNAIRVKNLEIIIGPTYKEKVNKRLNNFMLL